MTVCNTTGPNSSHVIIDNDRDLEPQSIVSLLFERRVIMLYVLPDGIVVHQVIEADMIIEDVLFVAGNDERIVCKVPESDHLMVFPREGVVIFRF